TSPNSTNCSLRFWKGNYPTVIEQWLFSLASEGLVSPMFVPSSTSRRTQQRATGSTTRMAVQPNSLLKGRIARRDLRMRISNELSLLYFMHHHPRMESIEQPGGLRISTWACVYKDRWDALEVLVQILRR